MRFNYIIRVICIVSKLINMMLSLIFFFFLPQSGFLVVVLSTIQFLPWHKQLFFPGKHAILYPFLLFVVEKVHAAILHL